MGGSTLPTLQTWSNTSKRLPQWQSKSKSTINHCWFETQIKLSIQKVFLPCPSIPYFAFVDLEKAFDRVPRKVLWWALGSLGVEEWAVFMSFSVSPSSRHGRLVRKVKGSVSTRKSDKHPVLSAVSGVGSNCDSAIADRCCVAWGKFRKLLPVLTTRYHSRGLCSVGYARW